MATVTARQPTSRSASLLVPRSRDFGPFKPLVPFAETDRALFFGREREVADLAEMLAGERASALLYGEAGIGKTSLVRAGLVPLLKSRGVACGLVEGEKLDEDAVPAAAPGGALLCIDDLGAALDDGPRMEKLVRILQKAGGVRGMKILFVIEDHDLFRMGALEKLTGHIGGGGMRMHLERMDEARVADAVERTVLGGGAYFESGLSQQIAVDLCKGGPVSPSEIQLVAGTAVNLRLNSAKAWRRSGGAEVLAWRFFEKACLAAGGRPAARALAEIASLPERGTTTLEQIARAADVPEANAKKLADDLRAEHLVRKVDAGWTMSSEWARPLARAYTGEARGRGVAARLVMREKIEANGLLSIGQVREIQRFAGALAPEEEALVRRSRQVGLAVTGALLAVPVLGLMALYSSYGRNYFFDAAPDPGAEVVVRLGRPAMALGFLPHSPRFGAVIADSGFARAALAGGVPEGVGPRAGDDWLRRLVGALKPLPRAVMSLIVEGELKPLADAYEDATLRPAVVEALAGAGKGSPETIALLQKALADPSEDVRRRAVMAAAALERRQSGAGAPLLSAALRDQSASVRALALDAIEKLPDEQAAPLLAAALAQTGDPVVRRSALEAIGAQTARTPGAASALGHAMLGPARAEATQILSRLLDGTGPSADAAEAAVTQVALDQKAPEETRLEALRLLRKRPKTPDALASIQGSNRVMAMAMPLLARSKPDEAQAKVAEAMKGPKEMRAAAAATIGLLPKTADTPKQLKALAYDPSSEVHAEAVRSLPVLGHEALPLLVKEAKGSTADVEKAAVETIGSQASKLGVSQSASALETIVKGARPSTRKAAIEALGRLAEAKPALAAGALGRLVHDKVPDVRADAAGSLGDVLAHGGKEAIAALKAAGRDPDAATRRRAAGALGRAGKGPLGAQAARALASFAGDPDPSVRAEAAMAMGALGPAGKEAGGALAQLVGDKDASVRSAARRAAREIGPGAVDLDKVLLASFASGSPADKIEIASTAGVVGAAGAVRAALADSDPGVRRAAAAYAGGLGTGNVASLVGALGDRDPAVRVAAVRGLVGAKAATALAQAAGSPDPDVRPAALEAIGEVGGPVAEKTLEAALSDGSERVRVAAVRGLSRMGKDAAGLLTRALADSSRDVREAAVAGLGVAWSELPTEQLVARVGDETDADVRYAAALALARQADGPHGTAAQQALNKVADSGTPAARLTARVARAFVGRADAMVAFLHILRDGA
ncbi:MAG TPA: HEAT repeat domain-containing protein [Polyangia bacterium]|nr:HEAT repeat domain-containing protein [Polyangia bacterium]